MFPNKFHRTLFILLILLLLMCACTFAYLGFFSDRSTDAQVIYEYDRGKEACYILGPNQQEKYVSCSMVELSSD
jgi:hypothetical protein